jgi:hypothetical protein
MKVRHQGGGRISRLYLHNFWTSSCLVYVLFSSPLFSKNATMDDNVHRFLDWFRQHGGYWHESLQPSKGEPSAERVLISSLTTCMCRLDIRPTFHHSDPISSEDKDHRVSRVVGHHQRSGYCRSAGAGCG